jgi:glutathione S-transferase
MALTAKGIAYETVEIDLLDRPDWLKAGPPRTRMPRLVTEEVTVHGASVANEYIDERWKNPPLLPGSAAERAEAREWINWLDEKLQPTYEATLLEINRERYEKRREHLDSVLCEFEDQLETRAESGCWSPGLYWHGEQRGMVDLSYAATFMRFTGLREFHGWEIPDGLPAVSAWIETLTADPVMHETFYEAEVLKLVGSYLDYFRAMASA